MFDLTCRICEATYLVGPRSILSLHHTSDGPVAYARCPRGHVNVVEFGRARTAAPTPAHASIPRGRPDDDLVAAAPARDS